MSRILVIDDDPGNRLIIKSRLSDLGFEVLLGETGASGLMEARGAAADLVLVAAGLGSGIEAPEVCRRLKAIPETGGVPALIYSNLPAGQEELSRAYEAGCDGFVAKHELPVLDQVVRVHLRAKAVLDDLTDQNRVLEQQWRRLREEHQRKADRETSLRESGEHSLVFRELAAGRPDGVLLVDAEGFVRQADRGACTFFGNRVEGRNLGSMAPASGLEAFVRDAHSEPREGFRFDLSAIGGRTARSLTASVIPLVSTPGEGGRVLKVVLLLDAGKRRIAAEMLRVAEPGISREQLGTLLDAARRVYGAHSIVGASACAQAARERLAGFAKSRAPVLLLGEKGTGKVHVARTLHYGGPFSGGFLALRCSGLEPASLERELFGYVEGAFKDARSDRPGLFQRAVDGTVLLEEVGDLPLPLQERLLRLLAEGLVARVGTEREESVDVRVIASSCRPLDGPVKEGRFVKALWELLRDNRIELLPLCERSEDIIPLAAHFVAVYGAATGVREIHDDAVEFLLQYEWPGNVGELEDSIRHACARAVDGAILAEHLPQGVRDSSRGLPPHEMIPATPRERERGLPAPSGAALVGAAIGAGNARRRHMWDITDEDPISLEHYEMKALMRALEFVGGDKLAAARLLNVGKSTLYRKLKRFDLK